MYTTLTQELKDKTAEKLANYLADNIGEVLRQLYVELDLENEDPAQVKKLVDDVLDAIADGSIVPSNNADNDQTALMDDDEEVLMRPANPTMYDWLTDNPTTKEFYVYADKQVYQYKADGRIPMEPVTK